MAGHACHALVSAVALFASSCWLAPAAAVVRAFLLRQPPMSSSLRRIDAHQHYWRLARGDYRWLSPNEPALAPICRDVLPAELAPLLARHGVVQTLLVQAADSLAETEWLLDLAARHDSIGGVVGWVDLSDVASIAVLERWATQPKFKGVRPMLQDIGDAQWIAHAPHPDVMHAVLRLGLRFDALVQPWHLQALLAFVRRWPELPVVIDHAAKPQLARGWQALGDQAWADAWCAGLHTLATLPQVYCKLSGLLTEAGASVRVSGEAGTAALRPVWHELLTAFGPARLIWGSDWPVIDLASDYAGWIAVSEALLADLPDEDDRQRIRHDNAVRFYALSERAAGQGTAHG
jgi:L-fuconolactonase